jgi:hypothetical protein
MREAIIDVLRAKRKKMYALPKRRLKIETKRVNLQVSSEGSEK